MADAETVLLARIKLAELARQRDRLHAHYDAVEAAAAAAPSLVARLRILYDGLREARFARKPFHPDVGNLDALFFEADVGTAAPAVADTWERLLRQELARGRTRADFALAFGRVIAEAADADPARAIDPPASDVPPPAPGQEPWAVQWSSDEVPVNLDFLRGIFDRHRTAFDGVRAGVRAFATDRATAPVTTEEVQAVLLGVARGAYRPPTLRFLAADVLASPTKVNEYAGVLTILLHNLPEWDWPAGGVPLRAVWTRNKWRPFLDESLLTVLFLQLIGLRWGMILKQNYRSQVPSFFGGLSHTLDVAAARRQQATALFSPHVPDSLPSLLAGGGYSGPGYESSPDGLESLLLALHAEQRYRSALDPSPYLVLQTDIREFYPRVPHAVVALLVEQLGFPDVWRDFLGKFLRARLRVGETIHEVRRGLVLDHLLGAVLAEWLLLLLDLHIQDTIGRHPLRVVDDIFVVTDDARMARSAWQAIADFCRATGLETNPAKSGAVGIGCAVPEGLPTGPPRWGMLRLEPDGSWPVDEEAFSRFRERVRREAEAAPSVLVLVNRYNDYLSFGLRQLGLKVPFEVAHFDRVGRHLAGLHQDLFGPGEGVVARLRRRADGLLGDGPRRELPEVLFYWPITAGGLGVNHPLPHVLGFRRSRELWTPPVVPDLGAQRFHLDASRYSFYLGWVRPLTPAAPQATPAMTRLTADFVERGSEVGGRQQPGLSPYWQWVLYTYGPQLLEELGTFRFLLTELVPLQLILETKVEATTMREAGGGPAPPPPARTRLRPPPRPRPPRPPAGGVDDIPF